MKPEQGVTHADEDARASAVNLARNTIDDAMACVVNHKGIYLLCRAVMQMDTRLRAHEQRMDAGMPPPVADKYIYRPFSDPPCAGIAFVPKEDYDALRTFAENAVGQIDTLRQDLEEETHIRERFGIILAEVCVALKGENPPLGRYSFHDLGKAAQEAKLACDIGQELLNQERERAEKAESALAESRKDAVSLLPYVRHGTLEKGVCAAMKHSDWKCDCGLAELLAAIDAQGDKL